MPKVPAEDLGGKGRICFRGDTRYPSQMFVAGFFSKSPNEGMKYNPSTPTLLPIQKKHRHFYEKRGFTKFVTGKAEDHSNLTPQESYQRVLLEGFNKGSAQGQLMVEVQKTSDMNLLTAVCVTPRFSMSVLFPLKEKSTDLYKQWTYVYALYVDSIFNTHKHQVADGFKAIRSETQVREDIDIRNRLFPGVGPHGGEEVFNTFVSEVALWPLYAQELATKKIEARNVVAAVPVWRDWKGDDWTYGANYEIYSERLKFNPLFQNQEIRKTVEDFFDNEPRHGSTPSRSSGFHKSELV